MATCETCGEAVGTDDNYCGGCGAARPAASRVVEVPVDDEPTSVPAPEAADATAGGAVDGTDSGLDADAESAGAATTLASAPTSVITTTGGVDLVACAACDSVNAAQRSRCAQCGAPLGEQGTDEEEWDLPDPDPTVAPDAPAEVARGRGRRGPPTWAWVVIVGVVVGVGIGVATALGIGPLARSSGPGVDFRTQAYPEAPGVLAPSLVGGSDVRADADGRSFTTPNLLDDDPTTAWEPADPDDAEFLLRFETPVWVTAIEFANGDQLDAETFEQTGRARSADIDMGRGQRFDATLIDGSGRQVVRLPTPALTTEIVVDVDEITGGDSVAISDVAVVGYVAGPRDVAAYREGE